jgi:tetratricopeptide (TPR) repeat protein
MGSANGHPRAFAGLVLTGLFLLPVLPFSHAAPADLGSQLEMARADEQQASQIEIIRRILEVDQENDVLRSELIDLWFAVSDYDMAEKTLNDWKAAPAETSALTTARILVERDKKPEAGITLLEAFLLSNNDSLPATEALTGLLWKESKNQRLVEFLQKSPLTVSQPGLLIRRAQAHRDLGHFAPALADAAAAKTLDPEDALVVATLASFERLDAAAPHLSNALVLLRDSPTDLQALMSSAYWKQYAGLPQATIHKDAEVAVLAHPESAAAKIFLARTSGLSAEAALSQYSVSLAVPEMDENAVSALVALDGALAGSPDQAQALTRRAAFLNATALQCELALKDADAALLLEPGAHQALLEQMTALIRLGKTNAAAAALNSLEAAKPSKDIMATALRTFAEAEFAAGENASALETVNRSLKFQRTAAALKLRAAIHLRLGLANEAKADLDMAATLEKSSNR